MENNSAKSPRRPKGMGSIQKKSNGSSMTEREEIIPRKQTVNS